MNKISLKEVFKNATRIYKEQRNVLLKISAFQMMISYAIILSSIVFVLIPQDRIILIAFVALLRLVFVLFAAYFSIRMYASLLLASKSGYYGIAGTVGKFYKEAGSVTWRCIGYRLLLGLIYSIPIIMVVVAVVLPTLEAYDIPFYVTVIIFLIGAIPLLILVTLFYYASVTTVVYRYPKSILGYSVRLLKGNVLNVFVLVMVSGIIGLFSLGYTLFLNVTSYGFFGQAGLYLIQSIILWPITPFVTNLTVSSMQMIEEKSRENIEIENHEG